MTKKKIYIILAIIFTIFIVAMTFVIVKHYSNKDSDIETIVEENYAVNEVKQKEEIEINPESYTKTVNNVIYQNFNNLNYEQQADKDSLIKLVNSSLYKEEAEYGKATSVDILSASDDQFVYVLVTFMNNETQEYILVYDDFNTHSFLNCQTVEQWDFYHSDENKG